MKIENKKIGDVVTEDIGSVRLTHKIIGLDSEGRFVTECISEVSICVDTTVETMIEGIKENTEKAEPKPVEKKPVQKAPVKKTTKKK